MFICGLDMYQIMRTKLKHKAAFDSFVLLYEAPSGGPIITLTTTLSSTSLHIGWLEVDPALLNGPLTGYSVRYRQVPSQFTNGTQWVYANASSPNNTELTLSNLEVHSMYVISAQAWTKAGPGPFAPRSDWKQPSQVRG